MDLASSADVVARLGRPLTPDEETRAVGLIEEASIKISEYCGGREFSPVPDAVRIVTSRIVARAIIGSGNPVGISDTTMTAGVFGQTTRYTTDAGNGGVYLSAEDRRTLGRWAIRRAENLGTSGL